MRLREQKEGSGKPPEKNLLALAILAIARSPKDRQADDLAYWVERDDTEGKKPEIPGFAVDGHTLRGKIELKNQAESQSREWEELFCEEFYLDRARSNFPEDASTGRNGVNWSRALMKRLGLDYGRYRSPVETPDDESRSNSR